MKICAADDEKQRSSTTDNQNTTKLASQRSFCLFLLQNSDLKTAVGFR